jgi:competence protein ComEC
MTDEVNIYTKINFRTANCFKLLIVVLLTFLIGVIFCLNNTTTLWLGIGIFICGGIIGIVKYRTFGFYLLSIALGFIIYSNSHNEHFIFTNYTLYGQPAIISGKVQSILNKKNDRQRIIIDGNFISRTIPSINNISILLTIIGESDIQIGDKIIADSYIRPPKKNIFEYDFNEVLYNRGIGTSWIGYTNIDKISIVERANLLHRVVNTCFRTISHRIDSIFTEETAGFVKAIILADRGGLSYEDRNKFAIAGVSHVLALSGLHIGIISVMLLFFLSLFKPNRWLKFIVFAVFVTLFVFLTGFQPSTIRAGLMAILFMLGRTMFRETNMLNVVSIVLLGIIVFSPSLLYSASFQMSLISVLGIFFCYDIIRSRLIRLIRNKFFDYIIYSIAITLSASIMVNPLVVYYFHILSIISPLTNILIVPIFSLGLVFAMIAIILSFVYFPLGLIYGYVVELLTKLCFRITDIAADFKYSAVSDYDNLLVISIIISVGFIYIFTSKNNKQIIFRLCIAVFIVLSMLYMLDYDKPNELKLYAKDKYCLLTIPLSNGSSFVWLSDRKPNTKNNQKYYNDEGLKKFIQYNNVHCIAINGNYGKEFITLYCKKIDIIELSHLQQRELEKLYLFGKYICQQ